MSYTSVKKILEDHDEAEIRAYEELVPMFERMAGSGGDPPQKTDEARID